MNLSTYELSDNDYLKSIWSALRRLEVLLAAPATSATPPTIVVEPPDLSDIVTAVTGLRPSVTAEEIAQALGDVLHFPEPQNANAALTEVAEALKKLEFRMKGMGTQAYGGGALTLEPGQTLAVTGPLTNTQLRAASVPVAETTGLVPKVYDYISLSYTGTDLTGVVYKTGGSGGTTVATLTLGYSSGILQTVGRT